MTKDQAIDEAKRRWGSDGTAWIGRSTAGKRECRVGFVGPFARHVRGYGLSWEAAFERADQNERTRPCST